MTFNTIITFLLTHFYLAVMCCAAATSYGQEVDGNQPTKQSPNPAIHWYKPLAGGPLKILVILPEENANEVDELAKRLDLVVNVIRTGARHTWQDTPTETIQVGSPAAKRLALTNQFDCILIGKVAWDVIPKPARELILKHVERGSGLVYVSPSLHDDSIQSTDRTITDFADLFSGPDKLGLYRTVYSRTAYAFSQLVYYRDRLVTSDLPALPRNLYRQSPFYLSSQEIGKGRVVALDYDDTGITNVSIPALIPFVDSSHFNALTEQVVSSRRDIWLFGLTMAILHSSNRFSNSQVSFLIKSVVPTPLVDRNLVTPRYLREMYPRQFFRYRLSDAEYYVVPPRADQSLKTFQYRIRSAFNQPIFSEVIEIAEQDKIAFKLPMLEQGHYLLDGFYLDKHGKVINCGNTSIQVVSVSKIRECAIPLQDLRNNGSAQCELILSQHLTDTQYIKITLTDIAGGELEIIPFSSDAFSRRFGFSLVTANLPAKPFVLQCSIVDEDGVVVSHRQLIDPSLLK